MEHKLIQGGDQYLPFARSRIKALRQNTSLQYASQAYDMPDGSRVRVRIEPGQDYIHLTGVPLLFLSGVIREGSVKPAIPASPGIDAVPAKLHEYLPTQEAWDKQKMDKKGATSTTYHDESRLVVKDFEVQYADVSPSMYSGLMAKVVAAVLAQAKPVKYGHKWAKCHGVLKGPDKTPWLIEISQTNGVLLQRLRMASGSGSFKSSKQEALKQTATLFGGIPSGATFPLDADLPAAIESGDVLQLLTPAALAPVYGKSAYSSGLGWSFNNTNAAHNTCFSGTTGYHYQIQFAIEARDDNRKADDPVVNATATLVEVESGTIFNGSGSGADIPFSFFEPLTGILKEVPYVDTVGVYDTVVHVYHHEGALETVRIKSNLAENTPGYEGPLNSFLGTSTFRDEGVQLKGDSYVDSIVFVGRRRSSHRTQTWVYTQVGSRNTYGCDLAEDKVSYYSTTDPWQIVFAQASGSTTYFWKVKRTYTTKTVARSVGLWPDGMRDGYVHFSRGDIFDVSGWETNRDSPNGYYDDHDLNFSVSIGERYSGYKSYWEILDPQPASPPYGGWWQAVYDIAYTAPVAKWGFSYGGAALGFPTGIVTAVDWNTYRDSVSASDPFPELDPPDEIGGTRFFGEIVAEPDKISVRVPNGDSITITPTYPSDVARDALHAAWRRPTDYTFCCRVSVLGSRQHAAISKNLASALAPDIKTFGALFTVESDPSSDKYNFIGHI